MSIMCQSFVLGVSEKERGEIAASDPRKEGQGSSSEKQQRPRKVEYS